MRKLRRAALVFCAVTALLPAMSADADHRDSASFKKCLNRLDIGGLYVFRSPTNANNTVLTMTVSPFAGSSTPATFKTRVHYEFRIAAENLVNFGDDLVLRTTFGSPNAQGVQKVALRGSPASQFPNNGVLANGTTGQNIPIAGGGQLRAGLQDDPEFFDAIGFDRFLNEDPFPRTPASNTYGPGVNILAITMEIPSSVLGPNASEIGVWARTKKVRGAQIDRVGRPLINIGLIPPVPRGPDFPNPGPDLRPKFNASFPSSDVSRFKAHVAWILQTFYNRSSTDANGIANLVLPDLTVFEIGNPNGFGTFVMGTTQWFGNGRRLRDDVVDVMVNFLTNGAEPTDGVPDDNGTKITDGNMGTTAAFPYIGGANPSPTLGPPCIR